MIELRHRHRLRRKEIGRFAEELEASLGVRTFSEEDSADMAEAGRFQVILMDNQALALLTEWGPFLTVRGLLRWPAAKRFVSVDEGAIRFICNGADVMGPGIVEVDSAIKEGELVWVRDARHLKPLAVGKALVPAGVMASRSPGKAVKTFHYVGDELWTIGTQK